MTISINKTFGYRDGHAILLTILKDDAGTITIEPESDKEGKNMVKN